MSTDVEYELLDWDSLEVHPEIAGGSAVVIKGTTSVPMRVELHPLPVGTAPEDYQGVQLRGHRGAVGPEVVTSFDITGHTKEWPSGRIGVVIIGATKREYIPPKAGERPE